MVALIFSAPVPGLLQAPHISLSARMYSSRTVHPLRPLPICTLVWEQEQLKGKQWCHGSENAHSAASLLLKISCWAGERSQNYHQLFPKLFWQSHRRIDSPGIFLSNVSGTEDLSPQTYSIEKRKWLDRLVFQSLYQKGFVSPPYHANSL